MTVYGSLGLLLVLLVLEVCVAVTVCVFSGKAIRRRGRHAPVTVRPASCQLLVCLLLNRRHRKEV